MTHRYSAAQAEVLMEFVMQGVENNLLLQVDGFKFEKLYWLFFLPIHVQSVNVQFINNIKRTWIIQKCSISFCASCSLIIIDNKRKCYFIKSKFLCIEFTFALQIILTLQQLTCVFVSVEWSKSSDFTQVLDSRGKTQNRKTVKIQENGPDTVMWPNLSYSWHFY